MAEEKTAKIVFANGNEYALTEKKARKIVTDDLCGISKKAKKSSIPTLNGRSLEETKGIKVEVVEGIVKFSEEGYKPIEFSVDCMNKACELVSKESWQIRKDGRVNQHPITGTHFVGVVKENRTTESPLGENLVKAYLEAQHESE